MPAALTFRPARADEPPGADLLEAMLAELEPLCGRIDVPGAQTASPAELAPPRGASLVGRLAGEPVACGGVMRLDRATCEIKRMYVAPPARRRGVGARAPGRLGGRGAAVGLRAGATRHRTQPAARRAPLPRGRLREIGNFNANPFASFWGEKRLDG